MLLVSLFEQPIKQQTTHDDDTNTNTNTNNATIGINVRGHDRAFELSRLKSLPVRETVNTLYPRLFALHAIADNEDYNVPVLDEQTQEVDIHSLPRVPVVSSEYLESDGFYVLNDNNILWLYLGKNLPEHDLEDWFNISDGRSAGSQSPSTKSNYTTAPSVTSSKLRPKTITFNKEYSVAAKQMFNAVELLRFHNPYKHELRVVWGDDISSLCFEKFATRLVEDSIKGEMSYVDFLCKVHSKIQAKP